MLVLKKRIWVMPRSTNTQSKSTLENAKMTNEFKHKSYELGMTITEVELSKRYTQALAQSMTITKQNLTASIINNVWKNDKPNDIEVDFDE